MIELGFKDTSHLSKTFKKYYGMSMSEFRRNGEYVLLHAQTNI
ncbi:AraC family transcriptional regulator [Reichenbachiella versicolor]